MIKNVIITVLVIYALGMTIFANLKANEAEKQKIAAEQSAMAAQEAAGQARAAAAEAQMAEAEAARAEKEAIRQRDLAEAAMEKALADCK